MAKRRRRRRRQRRKGKPKLGIRSKTKTVPPRRGSVDTSDEDFEMGDENEEQSSIDEDASSSAESCDGKAEDDEGDGNCDDIDERPSKRPRHSNRPSQRNRHSSQRGSSSDDEDFEIDASEDEDFVPASSGIGTLAIPTRSARRARVSSRASSSRIQRDSSHVQIPSSQASRNSRENARIPTVPMAPRSEQRLKDDGDSQVNKLPNLESGTANNAGAGVASSKLKGKEKISQDEELGRTQQEENAPVCGVCLCEDGQVERGKLDCCDHFFCFGCIMEWAKVESRCPMCKQRFVNIARAGGVGSKRSRTVRIPLRDQVYVPPEDDLLAVDDPYSDVICMECHESGEERLLLLCDHCDSAAHTYCVGLGRSVPRGDWFCRSCQALMTEVFGSEDEDEEIILVPSDGDNAEDQDFEGVEAVLRTIVASPEARAQERRQSQTLEASTSRTHTLSSSVLRSGRMGVRQRLVRRLSGRQRRRSTHAAPQLSQAAKALMRETELTNAQQVNTAQAQVAITLPSSARTVPRQRRLQERIQIMRTNWERIQTGSLEFSTLGAHSAGPVIITPNNRNIPPQTSGATEGAPKATDPTSTCEHRGPEHENVKLERVWEMMDRAKSTPSTSTQQRTRGTEQGLGVFDRQGNNGVRPLISSVPNNCGATDGLQRTSTSGTLNASNLDAGRTCMTGGIAENEGTRTERVNGSFNLLTNCGPRRMGNLAPCAARVEQIPSDNLCVRNTSGHVGTSSKQDLEALGKSPENFSRLAFKTSSDVEHESKSMHKHGKANTSLPSVSCSNQRTSTLGVERGGKDLSRTSEEHIGNLLTTHLEREQAADSSVMGMQKRKNERLKVHITDLVKKQLWPLYLTEGLGKEQFKQIARSAVHMLLDTLENGRHTVNDPTCGHIDLQDPSTLLGCCSSCLNSRVEKAVWIAKEKAHIR